MNNSVPTRIIRFAVGAALLPLTVAAVLAFFTSLWRLPGVSSGGWWLLGGMGAYALLALIVPRPVVLYVLGHELTHALWSTLFGGKASNLRITRTGGSVRVTVINIWVILAPYFFPLYTILVGVSFILLGLFVPVQPYYHWFLFLIGFTLQFHYFTTGDALRRDQPDIREAGLVVSLALIPLLNLVLIVLLLHFALPEMSLLSDWIGVCIDYSLHLYSTLWDFWVLFIRKIADTISR